MSAFPPASVIRSPRNAALDGLRGVAITLVVLCHGLSYGHPPEAAWLTWVQRLSTFMFGGVELFFVLSGYLIGRGLLQTRRATNQYAVFYRRRACRILPVYAILLVSYFLVRLAGVLDPVGGGVIIDGPVPLWSYFVFLQNNLMGVLRSISPWWLVITWSLAIEEQFYLVGPVIIRNVARSAIFLLAAAALVACPIERYLLFYQVGNPAGAIYLSFGRIESLLLGVAIAAFAENSARLAALAHYRALLVASVTGFAIAFFLLPFTSAGEAPFVIVWAPTLLGLGFATLLLWVLVAPTSLVARALSARPLGRIGDISYFVYLFHLPAIYLAHGLHRHALPYHADWSDALTTILAIAGTIVAACFSRVWLEQPIIAFGHRFAYKFHSPCPPVPSPSSTSAAIP